MTRAARDNLVGSKWTAVTPLDREKHFEVVGSDGANVHLRCVVNAKVRVVARVQLEDVQAWRQGWR